jgi:hypothetical protein
VNVGTIPPSWYRSSDDHIQYHLLLIRVQRDIVKWRQRLSISLDNISDAIAAGCQVFGAQGILSSGVATDVVVFMLRLAGAR